jgi:DNA-binding beta-propeller fold protein YncE
VYTDTCSTVAILNDTVHLSGTTVAYYPAGVAVSTDGTVAVTNLCPAPSCSGPGNIAFFAPGSTEITSVVTGLMSEYFFGAFDKHGNFYNDGLTSDGATAVGVVKHGSMTDTPVKITNVGYPGGIAVARNGTINIDDQKCSCIRIYKSSKQIKTVALSGTVDAITFAFTKTNSDIWVADKETAEVYEFPYPAGGSSINALSGFAEPIGVAVSPPSPP